MTCQDLEILPFAIFHFAPNPFEPNLFQEFFNPPTMELPENALLLRIFVGESDRHGHKPLYEALVLKAREMHLAGATVLRGPMGFGASSRLHTVKILQLSMDLPMVVEIVDTEDKINAFLPVLEEMMDGGLVTLEKARVIRYQPRRAR